MDILIIFYNSEYFGFLDINLYKLSCISVWPIFVDKNDTIKQFKLYLMLADPSAILVYICNVLYAILFIYNQNCMKWKDYQYKLVIFGWKWRRSIKIYQDQYIPSQKWEVFQFLLLLPFYIVNLGILLHFWGAAPLWLLWPSILQGEIELLRSKRRSNLLNFPYVKLIITEVCECVCLNYMALILDIIRMCNERTCLEWSETWILQRVWTRWKVLDIWKIL